MAVVRKRKKPARTKELQLLPSKRSSRSINKAKQSQTTQVTQQKRRANTRYIELIGLILIGFGIFLVWCVFAGPNADQNQLGVVGPWLYQSMVRSLGTLGFIFPFFVVFVGVSCMVRNIKPMPIRWGVVIVFVISLMAFYHTIFLGQLTQEQDILRFLQHSADYSLQSNLGAGVIGGFFVYMIKMIIGQVGAVIFYLLAFIISGIFMFKLDIKSILANIFEHKADKKSFEYDFDDVQSDRLSPHRMQSPMRTHEPQKAKPAHFFDDYMDDIKAKKGEPISKKQNMSSSEKEASFDGGVSPFSGNMRYFEAQWDKEKNRKSDNPFVSVSEMDMMGEDNPESLLDISTADAKRVTKSKSSHMQGTRKNSDEVFKFPPVELLNAPFQSRGSQRDTNKEISLNAQKLEETLASFDIEARVVDVSRGPVITRYELQPAPGVRVGRITNLSDDIALSLAASGVRIEAPIPGKSVVGIEVPNESITMVALREVIESDEFIKHPSQLACCLGKDIAGKNIIVDLAKMPHLLIAGATGSGKSVCINSMITSLLYKSTPEQVRMILVDPKVVELNHYNGVPHLLHPVVTDPKKAAGVLNWAVSEMTSRYKLFATAKVRDLASYNVVMKQEGENCLPQIVIIIDELADLMMASPKEVEDSICRLAQLARAAGIHLIIATQRPSVNVITGVIKANIPSRIAFAVSSQVDSRTILDMAGAEKLLGRGDMLYSPAGTLKPTRVQGCYIAEKEVESIVKFLCETAKEPADYHEDIAREIESQDKSSGNGNGEYTCDELLPQAIQIVMDYNQASASLLQRRLRVGYARASRLIDEMEERGIVSHFDGSSKPRNILMSKEEYRQIVENEE